MSETPLTDFFPPPPDGKVPLKANVFEAARQGNTQLLPLFPYAGPGDIVPCSAALASDGSKHYIGYFIHTNAVDEVAVTFGGAGRMRTGDVFVGPKTHGVGGDSDSAFFAVMTITQRQCEAGEQPEAITFQCERCNTELFKYAFNAAEAEDGAQSALAPFPTAQGTLDAALAYNASEDVRTCKSCGHVNPLFPHQIWGWQHYMFRTDITQKAWNTLAEAARS